MTPDSIHSLIHSFIVFVGQAHHTCWCRGNTGKKYSGILCIQRGLEGTCHVLERAVEGG